MKFSSYILPIAVIVLLFLSLRKKKPTFDSFAEGAKEGMLLAVNVFPFLAAVFVCVTLFRVSGLAELTTKFSAPLFSILGIPPELNELILIRPFSGAGTLAELDEIYKVYGADSYLARCASVILGSSETVMYVSAVYFSKTKIKNLGYALPLALFISVLGASASCLICRIL